MVPGIFGGTNDALNGRKAMHLLVLLLVVLLVTKLVQKTVKKDFGTALGVITRFNIGRNNNNAQSGTYQTQTRCEMKANYVEQIVSAGYVVTFNLDGQNVTVTMNN